jgi:hypothetical protein
MIGPRDGTYWDLWSADASAFCGEQVTTQLSSLKQTKFVSDINGIWT